MVGLCIVNRYHAQYTTLTKDNLIAIMSVAYARSQEAKKQRSVKSTKAVERSRRNIKIISSSDSLRCVGSKGAPESMAGTIMELNFLTWSGVRYLGQTSRSYVSLHYRRIAQD